MKMIILGVFCLVSVFSEESVDGYYSQYGQDRYMNELIFKNKRNGVFIEIGAADGVYLSNSYFFEKNLGWKGVCVEPAPSQLEPLYKNRDCHILSAAISNYRGQADFCWVQAHKALEGYPGGYNTLNPCDVKYMTHLSGLIGEYDPTHIKRIDNELKYVLGGKAIIKVDVYTFNDMMDMYGLQKVDFVTIDTEGGEGKILRAIDFDKYEIDVFFVECNYDDDISVFLKSKGYVLGQRVGCDLVFIRGEFYDTISHEGIEFKENCNTHTKALK